jgi:hypothetical protein
VSARERQWERMMFFTKSPRPGASHAFGCGLGAVGGPLIRRALPPCIQATSFLGIVKAKWDSILVIA